jgi:RNA polymerase sigma factor (sigma-70 family)
MMEATLTRRLDQTFRQERNKLLAFIKSRISSIEDAEDILQEVFFQAARATNVTEPIENLAAWLYRAARNRIVDWYRKKRFRTVPLSGSDEDTSLEDLLSDSGINIENDFLRTLAADALVECLGELPKPQREVFIMQEIEGRKFREIAELTATPVNTLIARKRYAVRFLRKRLEEIKNIIEEIDK